MADQQWSHGNIHPVQIDKEMKNAYIDYAMSVIVMRALPDVRDGLKPVHRRILYAMHETGMTPNKPYKKSARIVGDVLGKYHPHGDSSVYDATVRLAQDFNTRYLLVDGHGNFGSIDGDSAAAMRYTEVRMAKITTEMLADIDKETVDFILNKEYKRCLDGYLIKTQNGITYVEKTHKKQSADRVTAYVNAAHADDYANAPEELKKQEEDIMDDENF